MTTCYPIKHRWVSYSLISFWRFQEMRDTTAYRPERKRRALSGPPKVSARMLDAERCRRFKERRDRLSAAVLWAAIGAVIG